MTSLPYRYPQQPFHQQPTQPQQPGVAAQAPVMATQRFCLRWNNHQSNLLSVFDQLLHDESFVDVTLAVEGQLLRAHKMVLSACSPYFQSLFVNHPDKHPIVILKDVPYTDMKCLLDFMYRGEVSVDQDRLTAFLRVAESLRIKGLTEVNEEKCDTIANSLTQQNMQNNMPHLQRLQQQNQKRFSAHLNMLSNALMQPKRKRGRPRKLSGCSNGEDYEKDIVQGSPEMLEVKMGMDNFTGNNSDTSTGKMEIDEDRVKEEPGPVAGTSKEQIYSNSKSLEDLHQVEDYCASQENNQNHTNLPSTITIELLTPIKQESVIISTEAARTLMQENAEVEERISSETVAEATAGVHFLTDDENGSCKSETAVGGEVDETPSAASYEKRKNELLEYLTRQDGSVVCKLCGEVLASRTHWYRHKYKLHVSNLVNPVSLFKCTHCNVFFKSRKGYTGHVSSRHNETPQETEDLNITIKEEPLDPASSSGSRRKSDKSMDWEERREKEEKLVADIIDRVRKECEAQGGMVSRRGYSRRSTSIMNSA